ncbi:sulfotransferase [Halieaceae bacterium IMCC14734]|uniref:Sulfotransferase n=1 Tax=Candidatus Litorirhabdus singularis TaxID=2518993 RepID=A0ABT3TFA5_9GAMM|nr:sulfotransferase [Candidatus Litorirhabdus singularis]MCX2980992.1 sulfotransferase [Candidatus Litorirhabdus singularis]
MKNVTPIFLISLPRSGSTLAQRVLATHCEIATASEPWVMLPLYTAFESGLCKAEYSQETLESAVHDFCRVLPGGIKGYHDAVVNFAKTLYGSLASEVNASYFLDKTPRYHLIIHHLLEAFPEAKFVVLWRNPLATLGSRIHSYGGAWRLQNYHVDLFSGVDSLAKACQNYPERIHAVRYEDMVSSPEDVFLNMFDYLGLDYDPVCVSSFYNVELQGQMGDKTGQKSYRSIAAEPLEKWKTTLGSPVRRWWCRRYLDWVGDDRLDLMGYNKKELLDSLNSAKTNYANVPIDLARVIKASLFKSSRYK